MKGVWVERLPAEWEGVRGNSSANQKESEVMFLLRDWMSRGGNEILWLTN